MNGEIEKGAADVRTEAEILSGVLAKLRESALSAGDGAPAGAREDMNEERPESTHA